MLKKVDTEGKKVDANRRNCIDCDVDISTRGLAAKRCKECSAHRCDELRKKRNNPSGQELYIKQRKADAVTGNSYGITKKQLRFITHLLDETGYDYSDILILATRDGVIKRKDKFSIHHISVTEASRLIEYLRRPQRVFGIMS